MDWGCSVVGVRTVAQWSGMLHLLSGQSGMQNGRLVGQRWMGVPPRTPPPGRTVVRVAPLPREVPVRCSKLSTLQPQTDACVCARWGKAWILTQKVRRLVRKLLQIYR